VTQEELAECIGISRAWYGLLESDKPVRASLIVLDRLAAALMLSRDERTTLFNLGLPELRLTPAVSNESLDEVC
jgi:transcriptional regulator with XRE-family HTH domain